MELSKIFKDNIRKVEDIEKAKEINTKFLFNLKNDSKKDFKDNVSINWNVVDDFVAGKQWNNIIVSKDQRAFNSAGQELYNFNNTYDKYEEQQKPKHVLNITKSTLETLVATYCEIEPIPVAVGANDYYHDEELIHKINLLLKTIFTEENNFDMLYEQITYNALKFGYTPVSLIIDEDKSKTNIPIKIRYLRSDSITVDPNAVDINEADYVVQTIKMKYWQFKDNYNYQHSEYIKIFNDVKEPDLNSIIEFDNYWIRFRAKSKESAINDEYWMSIVLYNNVWCKRIINGKEAPLESYVYKKLPLVIFKAKQASQDRWYGEGIVVDMIDSQIGINETVSQQNWNWDRYVDPTVVTDGIVDSDLIKESQVPCGILTVPKNANVSFLKSDLIPSSDFEQRKQMYKNEMGEITGTQDIASRSPQGTYITSQKMLQTMQKESSLKPRLWEGHFMYAISELAEKSLYMLADYIGNGSITIWDSEKENIDGSYGGTVDIYAKDITDLRYKIDIETKDANLMTKEAKFEIITQMMQYGKIQELMHPYLLVQMVGNAMPDVFPKSMVDDLRKDYFKIKEQAKQQEQLALQQQDQEQLTMQDQNPNDIYSEENVIDDNYYYQEIQRYKDEMLKVGYRPQTVDETIDSLVSGMENNGDSREEILKQVELIVTQSMSTNNTGENV